MAAAAEINERADIVEVVSERVVLKRIGKDFKGLCPFHDDKSPSFTVSAAKGFYYCFSCGAGGNAIKFLMELDKRSFSDVARSLAHKYQVTIPERNDSPQMRRARERRDQLSEVMASAVAFYRQQLPGSSAQDYLDGRGIGAEVATRFDLGYAPGGWDALTQHLTDRGYDLDHAIAVGLVTRRKTGEGHYDRFRDRLIIPILDQHGRAIGLGGRTLSNEEPKYLNSPETELFDKGRTLFGLDKARGAIGKADQAIVVEGYLDVIALHSKGIENAVAAMGTALTLNQVKLLTRLTKRLVLAFDADPAGARAADRAIGELEAPVLKGDLTLQVLTLPTGKDADEFLKTHGADHFRDLLDHAPSWVNWRVSKAIVGRDLERDFAAVTREAIGEIAKLPNAVERAHQIHQLAAQLAKGDREYARRLEKSLESQIKPRKLKTEEARPLREILERQLLARWVGGDRDLIEQAMAAHQLDWGLESTRQQRADYLAGVAIELEDTSADPSAHLLHKLTDLTDRQAARSAYKVWVGFWLEYEAAARAMVADPDRFAELSPTVDRLWVICGGIR